MKRFFVSYLVKFPEQSTLIIVLFGITGFDVFSNLWAGVILGLVMTLLLKGA